MLLNIKILLLLLYVLMEDVVITKRFRPSQVDLLFLVNLWYNRLKIYQDFYKKQ